MSNIIDEVGVKLASKEDLEEFIKECDEAPAIGDPNGYWIYLYDIALKRLGAMSS